MSEKGRRIRQRLLLVASCMAAVSLGAGLFVLTSGMASPGFYSFGSARFLPLTAEQQPDLSGWVLCEDGWAYRDADGTEVDGWQQIGDARYYFVGQRMQTGFVQTEEGLYFLYSSGVLATGRFVYQNTAYLAEADGRLSTGWLDGVYRIEGRIATGWQQIRGDIWYFSEDGRLPTGWEETEKGRIYRDAHGMPLLGLQQLDGATYYFGTGGLMQTGFITEDGVTYYMDTDGKAVTGVQTIGGAVLQFDETGALLPAAELTVEVLYQNPALPNGCEITSLTELLQYLGFTVSHTEMVSYLKCEPLRYEGEICYAPDPNEAFIGNPATAQGWYCYEGPIVEAANTYLSEQGSDLQAVSITGADEAELLKQLQSGSPVVVWVTQQLADPVESSYLWTLPDGTEMHPYSGLHCVVLSGMDLSAGSCTVADPIYGSRTYDLERFMEIFRQVGSRAIIIK